MLLSLLGLDPQVYASYSLRIGATTDLVKAGASTKQIRVFGTWLGWKKTGYVNYIQHNVVEV